MRTQVCNKCEKELPRTEEFFKGREERSGLSKTCIACVRQTRIDASKKYYKKVRIPTVKDLPNTLTNDEWIGIKNYFNNRCCYCGKKKPLAKEHFIPVSQGGGYTVENIIPACKSCNSSKGGKNFIEWYPSHSSYSKTRLDKIKVYITSFKNEMQFRT